MIRLLHSRYWSLLFATCLIASGCGRDVDRPNIILVTLDTTRADRLGCYGFEPAHTPVLDSLATLGVVFDQAMTTVPVTLPAHCSILTGFLPTRHGVRDNGFYVLSDEITTVPEILQTDGDYQTGAFLSAFVLSEPYGTGQGFTTYDDRLYVERSAMRTSRAALSWVDKLDSTRPFFMWVHYYDPHRPLFPPEPYCRLEGLSPYDQEIAYMDGGPGHLLDGLRERGLLENTGLVVVGDHGEGLGDHGEEEHGLFLYDSTIQVPLIIVYPDHQHAGRRIGELTTVMDVAPTLLDLAGLSFADETDGHSLLPLIDGDANGHVEFAYSETYFPEHNFYHSHILALRSERWKFVYAPDPELYLLEQDPGEEHNMIRTFPDTANALKDRLLEIRETTDDGVTETITIDQEELERLQSLGYLGGGVIAVDTSSGDEFTLPDPKEMRPYIATFTEGLTAMNDGDWEKASRLLEEAIEQSPTNILTHLNLGKVYLLMGRFDDAVALLEETMLLNPDSSHGAELLGKAYQMAGHYEKSIATLQKIARHPDKGYKAIYQIARAQLLDGRPEEAQLTLRELSGRVGGKANIFSELSSRIGSLLSARDRLQESPDDEDARLALAGAALELHLVDEAAEAVEFTGSTPLIEARRHLMLGSIAGAKEDYATALAEFEWTLPYLGHDHYVLVQLSGLYLYANQPEKAVAICDRLIREGQNDPVVYYNKACAHAMNAERDEALKALMSAVRRGYKNMKNLQKDPDLESVRDDPRFVAILDEVPL